MQIKIISRIYCGQRNEPIQDKGVQIALFAVTLQSIIVYGMQHATQLTIHTNLQTYSPNPHSMHISDNQLHSIS
jgi:hypothetical protein